MGKWGEYADEGDEAADVWDEIRNQFVKRHHPQYKTWRQQERYIAEYKNLRDFVEFATERFLEEKEYEPLDALAFAIRALRQVCPDLFEPAAPSEEQKTVPGGTAAVAIPCLEGDKIDFKLPKRLIALAIRGLRRERSSTEEQDLLHHAAYDKQERILRQNRRSVKLRSAQIRFHSPNSWLSTMTASFH